MADDIMYRLRKVLEIQNMRMLQIELQNHVLFELKVLFNKICSSLSQYKLPIPNRLIVDKFSNRLLREEMDYDKQEL